jgi:ribosome-associated heat shock protein Hsp15
MTDPTPAQYPNHVDSVRLDKWLWAARFFKTRSLAKQAIEAGHVRYNGERSKVGREVAIGTLLTIRQGWDEICVEVLGLSDQRGSAALGRLLYRETEESRARRERAAAERHAANALVVSHARPDKKQRRHLLHFKRSLSGS